MEAAFLRQSARAVDQNSSYLKLFMRCALIMMIRIFRSILDDKFERIIFRDFAW